MRCFMDPIMQKTGPTPDQKAAPAMYDAVPERKADPECVTVLGSDFVLDESADICRILKKNGIRLREKHRPVRTGGLSEPGRGKPDP